MLPARPSPRSGLPAGPRRTQPREEQAPPRQLRSQRSLPAISAPRSRARPPPIPHNTIEHRRSDDSTSTISSNDSVFSRLRGGSGYASSRTSVEDDEGLYAKSNAQSSRSTTVARDDSDVGDDPADALGSGHGFTLWSRVATAASSLTVNVSKAWTGNVTVFAGEETPPGQESRLTRAMKAYHLEKARDPVDLPPWLFEEHERQPTSRTRPDNARAETVTEEPYKRRGLRDVYDAAASQGPDRPAPPRLSNDAPSKAADRLKALRDARRNGASPAAATSNTGEVMRGVGDRSDGSMIDGERRARRIGLPAGPGNRAKRL